MKPYPKYKACGIEWIGEIPSHWRVLRGKYVYKETKERSKDGSETLLSVSEYYGVAPRSSVIEDGDWLTRADTLVGYKKCNPGDLVMNIMLAWKRGLGTTDWEGVVSPSYVVFRCISDDFHPKYFHYLLRTDAYLSEFKRNSTGIIDSRLRLYPEEFLRMTILLPPSDEQKPIANYLDRKTQQIDTLIEKKEKQIDLLKEQRIAIINQAITKGLNPKARMKDSGVEWLGEIPEHWNAVRLKFICSLIRDGTHQPPPRHDQGIPLLSVRNIVDGKFVNLPDDSLISMEDYLQLNKSFEVLENDVLLAIVGATIGKVAIVPRMPPFTIQRSLAVFRPIPALTHFKYLSYFFQSSPLQGLIWQNAGFSAQPGIYLGALGNFYCTVPPTKEQQQIVRILDSETSKIDYTADKIGETINLLKAFRTTLISNVVSGKIDVRDEVLQ